MKAKKIPTLKTYFDWLEKAKYELLKFEQSCNAYDMANCFLTLNAIPDWIEKSDDSPKELKELKELAEEKIVIMKGINFALDENKLGELNHQLRLIRLFCNHSKHGDPKEKLKNISMSSPYSLVFPVEFKYLSVGSKFIEAHGILKNVIEFWDSKIGNT
jgi:hypothetical protein